MMARTPLWFLSNHSRHISTAWSTSAPQWFSWIHWFVFFITIFQVLSVFIIIMQVAKLIMLSMEDKMPMFITRHREEYLCDLERIVFSLSFILYLFIIQIFSSICHSYLSCSS